MRLSGGYDYRAGYADVYQGDPVGTPYKTDANDIRSSDAQAVVLWQPTERLTVRTRAWQFQTNQDYLQVMNSARSAVRLPTRAPSTATIAASPITSRTPSPTSSTRCILTNATSYQESLPGGFGVGLGLGPPLGVGTLVNGGHAHNAVNEFRLSSAGEGAFHWVAGTFYQNATGFYTFGIDFPTLALSGGTITRDARTVPCSPS